MIVRSALSLLPLLAAACLLLSQGAEDLAYHAHKTDDPQSIHVLDVDPDRLQLSAARARNAGRGRERVSTMARRVGALAAVNGGFFRIGGDFDGDPVGVLRIEGRWFSESHLARGAIGWSEGGRRVLIDRLQVGFTMVAGSWRQPVDGINRRRRRDEVVAYVAGFGPAVPETTLRQLVVSDGQVVSIARGASVVIPEDGFVAVLPDDVLDGVLLEGQSVRLEADFAPTLKPDTAAAWEATETIVGGTPVLVVDGAPVENFDAEHVRTDFVLDRHPRTAVCAKADGHLLLVVVDGRQPQLSVGMTLAELTSLLLELGCRDALNLDGGGSTTLFLEDKVVNSPSDPIGERAVSDAILILDRPR